MNRNSGTIKKENESESKYYSKIRIRIMILKNHQKRFRKIKWVISMLIDQREHI